MGYRCTAGQGDGSQIYVVGGRGCGKPATFHHRNATFCRGCFMEWLSNHQRFGIGALISTLEIWSYNGKPITLEDLADL